MAALAAACLLLAGRTACGSDAAWASEEATLRSVTFIDADQGWCAGDLGVILKSEDSGRSWRPLESSTSANLSAIAMFNSRRGLAVGGSYEPHTQIGRGVVVLTDDGGESWRPAEPSALPPLRRLLIGPRGRCIAAGDWSSVHGTNLFTSFNGGETWEAIEHRAAGAAIALAGSVDDFLVLSDQGELTRIRADEAAQPIMPPGSGWTMLAGEADLRWLSGPEAAMVSTDRGATWQIASLAAASPREDAAATGSAGAASAACLWDADVWSIDAAGTTIARHHATRHPEPHAPTAAASLRAIFRLDRDRGWAVGDWGTILLTRDGGRSWRTVRGEQRQPAVMAVANQGHQLPWSLLAIESQQHLRRVAIVTADSATAGDQELRVRDAARLIGPTAQHRCVGSARAIRNLLNAAPPAVLVLDQELATEEKAAWTSAAIEAGVRRVFETGRSNGQTIHYAAALPGAGKLAGDVWTDAFWLLQPGTLPPEKLQLGARFDTVADQLAADGLASCVGNDRRFVRQAASGTSRRHLQILQARSGESAWIESLVNSPAPISERVAQFEATLPRVAKENRQRLVFKVIMASKQRGTHEFYRAMLRQAARLWPDEPLGRLCDLHEQASANSREWQQMLGGELVAVAVGADNRAEASRAVQWSPFQSVTPAAAAGGTIASDAAFGPAADPASGGVQLSGGTEPSVPGLATPASFDAVVSSIEPASPATDQPRGQPGSQQKNGDSQTSNRSAADRAWDSHPAVVLARRSQSELALPIEHRFASAVAPAGSWAELTQAAVTPAVLRAGWAAQRPLLDGDLSESIWATSQSFPLARGESGQLHIAYDADFVYLAVQGPALRGEPRGSVEQRKRDTPLDHDQRYVIRIDVDGDLLTAYELEFDSAGNTRDRCDGFTQWQPRWFLALAGEGGSMIAEIAIQRSDLVGPLQQPGQSWNVSLQRRDPGQNVPVLALSQPDLWRRLVFD